MRIFIKKGVRTDMERQYIWTPYNKAFAEAKEHLDVDGVKEYLVHVEKKADDYETEMKSFLENERPMENERYSNCEMSIKNYNSCVWVGIGLILLKVLFSVFLNIDFFKTLLNLAICVYVVVLIVFRFKASRAEKQYCVYSNNVLQQVEEINNRFQNIIDVIVKDVDQMYLDSLDPTTRQLVLMRRELSETQKKNEQLQRQMIDQQSQMIKTQQRTESHLKDNTNIQRDILNNLNEWRDERHS